MAFPVEPLVPEVGILIDGVWVNAVEEGFGVRERDSIQVNYGRSNWATVVDPSRANWNIDNRDGRWSPDNPDSLYYGQYKRNLPARVGLSWGVVVLQRTEEVNAPLVTSAYHSSYDITGDIDVRIEFRMLRQDSLSLAGRFNDPDGGWALSISISTIPVGQATVSFSWVDSSAGFELYDFPAPWAIYHERMAVRVTLDVSTGEGILWTSDAIDGTWTQYGDPVTSAGATSIGSNTTTALRVGNALEPVEVYAFELRSGIAGTTVASPDFTAQDVGDTSFNDAQGRTWTLDSAARLSDIRWRFHGEMSSLPVRWNIDGSDVWAPVEASGLLRRLRQNNPPAESALRKALELDGSFFVSAYWPMEETGTKDLTRFYAEIGSGSLTVTSGQLDPAREPGFLASSALPVLRNAVVTGTVSHSGTGEWQVQWLQFIPVGTTTGTDVEVLRVTTGDATWVVEFRDTNGGDLRVIGSRGSTIYTSSYVSFNAIGKYLRFALSIVDNGANVNVQLVAQEPGGTSAGFTVTNAVAADATTVTQVRLNGDALMLDWAVGHLLVSDTQWSLDNFYEDAYNAWIGEKAGNRLRRLCAERGISIVIEGDPIGTEAMGPQRPGRWLDLLDECAKTDLGILHESREIVGLRYRTRTSMTSQLVQVPLDYTAGHISNSPELDRDDQGFANEITVKNWNGATTRVRMATFLSPVAYYEPPDGVGLYPTTVEVNLEDDVRAVEIAGALLDLSAVDEPRVSRLSVSREHGALAATPSIGWAVLDASLGDLVEVDNNLDLALGNTQIRQVLQGTKDTIEAFRHRIDMLTSAGSPWDFLLTASLSASLTAGLTAAADGYNESAAFPVHVSTTDSATNTGSTSHNVSIGSTAAGDLLIALLFFNSDTTVTGPGDGWTRVIQNFGSPGTNEVWMKIADGSDGATQTWTTSSSQAGAFQVLRISDVNGGITEGIDFDFEVAAEFTATTAPNPPSVTASWGSANNLFIAWTGYGGDNAVMNSYPTNYDTNQSNSRSTNGGGGGGGMASASRQLASATDDPGAFGLASNEFGFVYTMVVRPA